jgi:hypothetical protein
MGALMSTLALVLAFAVSHSAADVVLLVLVVAAGLESIFAYCIGCQVFAMLMRVGVIPKAICAECADVGARIRVRTG